MSWSTFPLLLHSLFRIFSWSMFYNCITTRSTRTFWWTFSLVSMLKCLLVNRKYLCVNVCSAGVIVYDRTILLVFPCTVTIMFKRFCHRSYAAPWRPVFLFQLPVTSPILSGLPGGVSPQGFRIQSRQYDYTAYKWTSGFSFRRNRSHGRRGHLRAHRYRGQGNGWSGDHTVVHVGGRRVYVGGPVLRRVRHPDPESRFSVRVHLRQRRRILGVRHWMEHHTRAHDR